MTTINETTTTDNPGPRVITASELLAAGLTPDEVRRCYPWAVERVALDGEPCWLASDLEPLLRRARRG